MTLSSPFHWGLQLVLVAATFWWLTARAAPSEEDAKKYVEEVNKETQRLAAARVQKEWTYKTSLTQSTSEEWKQAKENFFTYRASVVNEFKKYNWDSYKDPSLRRQYKLLSKLEEAAVAPDKRAQFFQVISKMLDTYNSAKIKSFKASGSPTLKYSDVSGKFANEYRESCKMTWYWEGWHNTIGRAEKPDFVKYVALANEVAKANGHTNNAVRWQSRYEIENFETFISNLWKPLDALMKQIHAFVRRKLFELHGESVVDIKGPIPANLLGSIWGMNGITIYDLVTPISGKTSVDATPQLKAKNYNGKMMAEAADAFFQSLGMDAMTKEFWDRSILDKPTGKDIDCAPETFNFYDGKDYRLKSCTAPTLDDFGGIHHEMGKIQNFMAWKNLPFAFQTSPSPGFSEVLGEVVNQFVTSPKHLQTLKLIDANWAGDDDQEINFLMQQALYYVMYLPYAYSMDLWRWKIFKGSVKEEDYNCEYWKTRIQLQGVEPAVDRTAQDLDPAVKHHVVNDEEYIKYFLNIILQYQWHRALCELAGEYTPSNPKAKPLYLCDITGNKAVGAKLKQVMELGASKSWKDALQIITGKQDIDADAMVQYFKPLEKWLIKQNSEEKIGWDASKKGFCNGASSTASVDATCRYR